MTHVKSHYRKTSKGRRTHVKAHTRKGSKKVPRSKPRKKDLVDIVGDQINKNYQTHIETNWDSIQKELRSIPHIPEGEDTPYAYFSVRKSDKNVELEDITSPDYFRGVGGDYWLVGVPVDRSTTKKELLEVDASEESFFYEDF